MIWLKNYPDAEAHNSLTAGALFEKDNHVLGRLSEVRAARDIDVARFGCSKRKPMQHIHQDHSSKIHRQLL
ncbi:hypothetical protein [Bradyrhizobium sp. S3.2.12]|uniref:hypothetical protein n=1 Tax=Bradyrhizobium sp. S3.2.12 TaxID=3156387 RepID=UPI00339B894B